MNVNEYLKKQSELAGIEVGIKEFNKLVRRHPITDLDIELQYKDGRAVARVEIDLSERVDKK